MQGHSAREGGRSFLPLLLLAAAAAAEPLETFNNRLFVEVTVNGQRATALLDSAAEMTIIDDDFAARLGLVPTGSATAHGSGAAAMEARFAEHVAIEAPGGSMELRVGILDLGEVSQRLLGRNVDLLLGRELFDNARLRIDIARRHDRPPSTANRKASACRSASIAASPPFPPRSRAIEPVQAVFDLGNGSDLLIGRAYAERIGLTAPERIVERRSGGGLGGARQFDIVDAPHLHHRRPHLRERPRRDRSRRDRVRSQRRHVDPAPFPHHHRFRRTRNLAGAQRMTKAYDYDLFVIGAGSGGVRAARVSAAHGARVAIAEEYKVGGTCVIRGCVPKKLLVYGAHFAEDLQDARRFGWKVGKCKFDWPTLRDNVLAEVERLEGIYTDILERHEVEILAPARDGHRAQRR